MEQAKKATSDDLAAYKAAFAQRRPEASENVVLGFLRAFSGPKRAIQKARQEDSQFLAGKKLEIVSISDTHTVIRLHWPENLPLSPDFCLFSKGRYQAIPTMFHLAPARLWERVCFFQGGPYCEYELWWDKKPAAKRLHTRAIQKTEPSGPPQSQKSKDRRQTKGKRPGRPKPHKTQSETAKTRIPKGVSSASHHPEKKRAGARVIQDNSNEQGKAEPAGTGEHRVQAVNIRSNGTVRELRHLLSSIQGTVSSVLSDTDSRHRHFEPLKGIEGMIKQGVSLTTRLLSKTSKDKGEVEKTKSKQQKVATRKAPHGELLRGTETVLLVDDDEMLIDVGRQMLEAMGYKVLMANTGAKAVEVLKKNKDRIDMVILDMVMPDMGGGEAYNRMRQIKPNIKVLLSSGYSIQGEAINTLAMGCGGLIQKPFSLEQLSEKMRAILDSK
jgi:CheY-like chemotaxis protein